MNAFDTVIQSAMDDQLTAIDRNSAYNAQRKREIEIRLRQLSQVLERLDDLVSIQFDALGQRFEDHHQPDYLAAVRQLQRQHEVARESLERELTELTEELSIVNTRLITGGLHREVAEMRRQLNQPFRLLDLPPEAQGASREDVRESLDYLGRLSQARILKRSAQIASLEPEPVDEMVIRRLIDRGN
jgi:hypothetical protein